MLWRLVHEAPPEIFGHVLDKLPPEDLAMLSRVDSACCQAVVRASGLPLAGSCRSKPFQVEDFVATVERLRWARTNGLPWDARTFAVVRCRNMFMRRFRRAPGGAKVGAYKWVSVE